MHWYAIFFIYAIRKRKINTNEKKRTKKLNDNSNEQTNHLLETLRKMNDLPQLDADLHLFFSSNIC